MSLYLPLVIALIVIIVFGVGLVLLYQYVEHKVNNEYKNLPTKVKLGSGSNMKSCPSGCTRGTCKYNPKCRNHLGANPECCAFDFQCQYCKDKTGNYYLKPDVNPHVDMNYNINDNLTTTEELNEAIAEQNRYISKLNKDIMRTNRKIMRREAKMRRRR